MKDLNNIKKNNELLKNILDSEGSDKSVEELEKFSYGIAWTRIYEDLWIVEAETMYDVLDYFIRVNDTFKIEYISGILNKFYPNFLVEKLNELIKNEEYEICSILTKLTKI